MSCAFDKEKLTGYFDGELDRAERAGVEQHISSCSECLRDLEEIKSTAALVRGLPPLRAPSSVAQAVSRETGAGGRVHPFLRARTALLWAAAAAAGLLVVVNIVYFTGETEEKVAVRGAPKAPGIAASEKRRAVEPSTPVKKSAPASDELARMDREENRRATQALPARERAVKEADLKEMEGFAAEAPAERPAAPSASAPAPPPVPPAVAAPPPEPAPDADRADPKRAVKGLERGKDVKPAPKTQESYTVLSSSPEGARAKVEETLRGLGVPVEPVVRTGGLMREKGETAAKPVGDEGKAKAKVTAAAKADSGRTVEEFLVVDITDAQLEKFRGEMQKLGGEMTFGQDVVDMLKRQEIPEATLGAATGGRRIGGDKKPEEASKAENKAVSTRRIFIRFRAIPAASLEKKP